jgi:asparagine synthase (glutamine-hydrolysing)
MAMSEVTKDHVTVVLTGDGGDECFGGYPNYLFFKYLNLYQKLPKYLYKKIIPGILKTAWKFTNQHSVGKQFYRSEILSHSLYQAYVDYYAIWQKDLSESKFYLSKKDLYTPRFKSEVDWSYDEKLMEEWLGVGDPSRYGTMNRAMLGDMSSRLSEDYLMKVDFGAMAFALETRPPFLDHRLVEKALQLPEQFKIHHREVKWIWKQVVKDKLPETILTRKKMGFGIPIGHWMQHDLYEFVKNTLMSASPLFYEYIEKATVIKLIEDHKRGYADYSNHIWSLLLLNQWINTFFNV